MASPFLLGFEGRDAEQLRAAFTESLAGQHLTLKDAPQTEQAGVRGVDLPMWFTILQATTGVASDLSSVAEFLLGLLPRKKNRTAGEQAADIQAAQSVLAALNQNPHLDAQVVVTNRATGRVVRVSASTKASELDDLRPETDGE